MSIKPYIRNEWGKLKEIIVGRPEFAQIPTIRDKSLHTIDYANYTDDQFRKIPYGTYPNWMIEETKEDLDNLSITLEGLGVKVHRPSLIDWSEKYSTENWEVDGYYGYCPRDSMLVIEDKVIATPMALRQRQNETRAFKHLFDESHWVDFPKPKLLDSIYDRGLLPAPTLRNDEPVFDAANILKCNNDILFLISNTGNRAGAEYLQKWLDENMKEKYNVHPIEDVYAFIHIDTTFVLIREGLVLVNPKRVNSTNLPKIFQSWEVIYSPEMVETNCLEHWAEASPWLGMNTLSYDENTMIVEERQLPLMKELKKYGVDSIPVKMRHARTFSGGPHCVTLDTIRE
jgi:N-dimethylarginine dimethylaminohydrolase